MAISDLVSEFISRFKTYTPVVHLLEDSSFGTPVNQKATSNAAHVYNMNGVAFVDEANRVAIVEQGQYDYETVAASQSDQALGATGAAGDLLHAIWIIPATTSPGAVSLKDGAGSSITLFAGGASSVADLKPFKAALPEDAVSTAGAWSITTGANVSAIASGRFAA